MRKKWWLVLTLAMMSLLMLIPSMVSAAEVDITTVRFNISINGRRVDHSYRKYPLIFYNSITYFPMTYNDCAYLGISNTWTPETGNIIEKAEPSGYFDDTLDPLTQGAYVKAKATIVTTPITILGEQLNNEAEQYPILSYKDVLYFPLTWDWAQKFGWTVELKSNNLEVATADFEGKGTVVMYDLANGGAEKIFDNRYYSSFDYHTKTSNGNIYSSSKNYTFYKDPIEGFVTLYRFFDDGMYNPFSCINVRKELAAPFLENGWFEAADIEAATHEYLKTHSKNDTNKKLSIIMNCTTLQSSLLSTEVSDVIWKFLPQYTTLYAFPDKITSVKNEEVTAYKNVGWMTGADYLYSLAMERENAGDTEGALRVLEAVWLGKTEKILGFFIPPIEGNGLSYYLAWDPTYKSLFNKFYPKLKNNLVYAYSYSDDNSITLLFRGQSVKGLKDFHCTISYDMYDAAGNYIRSAQENMVASFWMEEANQIGTHQYYIYKQDCPGVAAVANVKISNIKIVDYEPGFEG